MGLPTMEELITAPIVANSRGVAAYFVKAHRSVLMAIDDLAKRLPIEGMHNFMPTPFVHHGCVTGTWTHRGGRAVPGAD